MTQTISSECKWHNVCALTQLHPYKLRMHLNFSVWFVHGLFTRRSMCGRFLLNIFYTSLCAVVHFKQVRATHSHVMNSQIVLIQRIIEFTFGSMSAAFFLFSFSVLKTCSLQTKHRAKIPEKAKAINLYTQESSSSIQFNWTRQSYETYFSLFATNTTKNGSQQNR